MWDRLLRLIEGGMESPLPKETTLNGNGEKAKFFQNKGRSFLEEIIPRTRATAQSRPSTQAVQGARTQPPVPTPTLIPDAPENPYMELLRQYFPQNQVNNASNVMFKESGFNPGAIGVNSDGAQSKDYGLFQINDYWQRKNLEKQGLTIEDLLDPETAIRYASQMQGQQGWEPWYGADSLGFTSRSR